MAGWVSGGFYALCVLRLVLQTSQPQLPERLGRWADGVLPGEGWGDSSYWGLLGSTLMPNSPGAPLGLPAPGSVQCPSAHFGGLLLGLEEAAPHSGCFHGDPGVRT